MFHLWLAHRMELVGYPSRTHLSRAAGFHASRWAALEGGSDAREVLSDAELVRLARLLSASILKVRQLAEGVVSWIDDDHWIGQQSAIVVEEDRGRVDEPRTPALGRVMPDGRIDLDEQWETEFGPWLPCRIGSGKGTFGLKLMPFDPDCGFERWAIFRLVGRDCLPERQDVAVLIRNDWETLGLFGRLSVVGSRIVVHLQDRGRTMLEFSPAQVAQVARVVGSWPEAHG